MAEVQQNQSEIVSIQFGTSEEGTIKYLLNIHEAKNQIDVFNLKLQKPEY